LQIKGITIKSPRTTIYKTFLGDHKGNHFTIRIRNLVDKEVKISKKMKKILQQIDEFNGIPNFFGHQRFGTRRPISHEIGRLVLLGNLEEAIRLYLTFISDDESEITKIARKTFLETNDSNETIKILPKTMIFEKMILEYLATHPSDFSGAFHLLPKNLQRMFIHSYQSYIWNMTLSERMEMFGNLHPQSIDLIENGQAVLPIIGYKTQLEDNELSDYIKKLLEQEEMKLDYFKVNSIPSLKFMGSNRLMAIKPKNFSFEVQKDEKNQNLVKTEFSLKSGSYATIILREFMKTTPIDF